MKKKTPISKRRKIKMNVDYHLTPKHYRELGPKASVPPEFSYAYEKFNCKLETEDDESETDIDMDENYKHRDDTRKKLVLTWKPEAGWNQNNPLSASSSPEADITSAAPRRHTIHPLSASSSPEADITSAAPRRHTIHHIGTPLSHSHVTSILSTNTEVMTRTSTPPTKTASATSTMNDASMEKDTNNNDLLAPSPPLHHDYLIPRNTPVEIHIHMNSDMQSIFLDCHRSSRIFIHGTANNVDIKRGHLFVKGSVVGDVNIDDGKVRVDGSILGKVNVDEGSVMIIEKSSPPTTMQSTPAVSLSKPPTQTIPNTFYFPQNNSILKPLVPCTTKTTKTATHNETNVSSVSTKMHTGVATQQSKNIVEKVTSFNEHEQVTQPPSKKRKTM